MFNKTNNPYEFKYIITGISGPGITTVYLPEIPSEEEILFKKEQKFVRTVMPKHIHDWSREWDKMKKADSSFQHPHAAEIVEFEDQEWDRITNGIFFWNNDKIEYISGFYYWYCTYWQLYFGYPSFRATDMEISYFFQYCEEDPNSYGTLLNTIRRYGKSSIMGGWLVYSTITNSNWTSGMQGENDKKIKKFFGKFITKPFFKLPEFIRPLYDTSTEQKNELNFDRPPRRGSKVDDDLEYLESIIEFRSSEEGAYDQEVLHRYLMEEPGKTLTASVQERWDIVKPCLKKGTTIRGKAVLGTTVDQMESKDKGGKAYKDIFFDSDVDKRGPDGRTITGLYMCFVPGDSALEDSLDEWGYPDKEQNKKAILQERAPLRNNPAKFARHVRQYPITVKQIFYVSAENCEFDVKVLQDRQNEIELKGGVATRGDFVWTNGKYSNVEWRPNQDNGKCLVTWIPDKNELTNLVKETGTLPDNQGIKTYKPLNNHKIRIGHDPIQHGVTTMQGRSKPVLYVKRLYDESVDGVLTDELMIQRAKERYMYKTNTYVCQYDYRFQDPNMVFDYILRICRFYGASIHVEKQKSAIINYFYQAGHGEFIMSKFQNQAEIFKKGIDTSDGTAASQSLIQQYTTLLQAYVLYFGHTIPFLEQIEDMLIFDVNKTKEHDYTVAAGFTELACQKKVEVTPNVLNLEDIMPIFDNSGNTSQIIRQN